MSELWGQGWCGVACCRGAAGGARKRKGLSEWPGALSPAPGLLLPAPTDPGHITVGAGVAVGTARPSSVGQTPVQQEAQEGSPRSWLLDLVQGPPCLHFSFIKWAGLQALSQNVGGHLGRLQAPGERQLWAQGVGTATHPCKGGAPALPRPQVGNGLPAQYNPQGMGATKQYYFYSHQ